MKKKTKKELKEIVLIWLSGVAGLGVFFLFLYPIQPSGYVVGAAFACGIISSLFYDLMRGDALG